MWYIPIQWTTIKHYIHTLSSNFRNFKTDIDLNRYLKQSSIIWVLLTSGALLLCLRPDLYETQMWGRISKYSYTILRSRDVTHWQSYCISAVDSKECVLFMKSVPAYEYVTRVTCLSFKHTQVMVNLIQALC